MRAVTICHRVAATKHLFMEHNSIIGALLKSIIGKLKSITGSGLFQLHVKIMKV